MLADGLTLFRAALAPVLVAVLGAGRLGLGAILLSAAWISDYLDGRAARASAQPTSLGQLDLPADTLVGVAVLVGLALAGEAPPILAGVLVAVLGSGYVLLRNAALSQALQAVGYAWLLAELWVRRDPVALVPLATIAALLAVGAERLVRVVVPAFLHGAADVARLRRRAGYDLEGRGSR